MLNPYQTDKFLRTVFLNRGSDDMGSSETHDNTQFCTFRKTDPCIPVDICTNCNGWDHIPDPLDLCHEDCTHILKEIVQMSGSLCKTCNNTQQIIFISTHVLCLLVTCIPQKLRPCWALNPCLTTNLYWIGTHKKWPEETTISLFSTNTCP